ncbi:MAG: hypothetical protein R2695_07200 [Acidimicrobiales bacterium]
MSVWRIASPPTCRPLTRPPDGPHPAAGRLGAIADHGLEGLDHSFLTGSVESLVNWARTRSCWPATFGLACCAIEMMATGAGHYDLSRYGMEVFGHPRQSRSDDRGRAGLAEDGAGAAAGLRPG